MQYEVFGRNNVELILPETFLLVDETGSTYEENALIKAAAWADVINMPTIADDSGLEVAALSWGPGIHSARAAQGNDGDRVRWLLRKLDGLANIADRRACFVSNIVVAFPRGGGLAEMAETGRRYFSAEGRCWGTIASKPRGSNGFGYDPVFMPDGYDVTFGELAPGEKSKISHRAIAMKGMAQMLPCMIKYRTVRDMLC